jgi:hypothetical protein
MKRLFVLAIVGLLMASATVAALASHPFVIDNRGRHKVISVKISGVDHRRWGPNLLSTTVPRNYHTSFTISEGCMEDVLVTYENGRQLTKSNFNTCRYNLQLDY